MAKIDPERKFSTFGEAAQHLIAQGWFETNAGWLDARGSMATVIDRRDDSRNIPRHSTIHTEPCDANGRPLTHADVPA